MRLLTAISAWVLMCGAACAWAEGRALDPLKDKFRLVDSEGKGWSLAAQSSPRLVLMSIDPACGWSAALASWSEQIVAGAPGAQLVYLYAGRDRKAVSRLGREGSPFRVLMDFSQVISRKLGFRENGDYLVLDQAAGKVIGSGNAFGLSSTLGEKEGARAAYLRAAGWISRAWSGRHCSIPYAAEPLMLDQKIAQAVLRSCINCHSREPALDYFRNYQDLKNWQAMSRQLLRNYEMPPGGTDYDTPDCAYGGASNLNADDLSLAWNWIEAGAQRNPADPDFVAEAYSSLQVRKAEFLSHHKFHADLTWKMKAPDRIRANGLPEYRTTTLGPFPEDLFVRGVRLAANMRLLHHVDLLMSPKSFGTKLDSRKGNTARSHPEPLPTPWASWGRASDLGNIRWAPDGSYIRIPRGTYVTIVHHYEPSGRDEENLTAISLQLAPDHAKLRELHINFLPRHDFVLSPGQANFILQKKWVTPKDISLTAFWTHGHYRLVASSITAKRPGQRPRTLCNIPFRKAEYTPLSKGGLLYRVPAGTEFTVQMAYDNSAENPANPDPHAVVRTGRMLLSNEMETAAFTFLDGFLPSAKELP